MQVLNAIKKIAAVSTGVAMLGATLTGALALKLSDYPAPFVDANGVYDNSNAFVVGAKADAADTLGLALITANLQFLAKEEVDVGGVVVGAGQKLEDLPLARSLNDSTDGFGSSVDHTDISALKDAKMHIDINQVNDDYDYKEELSIMGRSGSGNVSVETGLTYQGNVDEDWKDNVFVTLEKNSWGYYFVFEDTLKAGNYLNDTSTSNRVDLPFLGHTLRVDTAASNTSMTANIGERFDLAAGDSVEVEGKTVVFMQASTGSVRISVDGQEESIDANTEEVVGGLAVRVENVDNDEGIQYDRATFWAGKDARKTISSGDEYTGEPQDNPRWVWHLAALQTGSPTIGVRWALNVDSPTESDNPLISHPLYVGEKVCLPDEYACLEFNSLVNQDYQLYKLDTDTADLYNNTADARNNLAQVTSAKVMRFRAVGLDGNGFDVSGTNSDTLYFYMNNSGLQWYFEDQGTGKPVLSSGLDFGAASNASSNNLATFKFKDNTIPLDVKELRNTSTAALGQGNFWFVLDGGAASAAAAVNYGDVIHFVETSAQNQLTYLGDSDSDTTTANDLRFANPSTSLRDITGWEENTRTQDGLIILDPDAHKSSDTFEIMLPGVKPSDFKANVVISVKGSAAAAKQKAYLPTQVNPMMKLDSEVSDASMYNLVVVGGPCANSLAQSLFGLSCDGWALQEGEALLKMMENGEKVALLVAGTSALDSRRASHVVAKSDMYLKSADKAEAVVKGTSAAFDDVEVE